LLHDPLTQLTPIPHFRGIAPTRAAARKAVRLRSAAYCPLRSLAGAAPAHGFAKDMTTMKPARAFFASMSMSLLVLTLSYQAMAIPATTKQPMPKPKSDAWMDHASSVKVKKGQDKDDMSELVPLLGVS
jgi:hypothetical protein